MLPNNLLTEYASKFYGFGTWNAKIWFIGIEEAGGWSELDVRRRLEAWKTEQRELEDAPTFYPACGNNRWHATDAVFQHTWKQLIRMLLTAHGKVDSDADILNYQRTHFGRVGGRERLAELLPLPSPSSTVWKYHQWSSHAWLRSRSIYQNHMLRTRITSIQRQIDEHKPKVVIFYSSTWHRTWAVIARGAWSQAINGKLMNFDRDGISFYVTRHPRAESDEYFRQIGVFLREKHGGRH